MTIRKIHVLIILIINNISKCIVHGTYIPNGYYGNIFSYIKNKCTYYFSRDIKQNKNKYLMANTK